MTLTRPTYLVEILDTPDATEGTVHEVVVLFGDQMRAELEAAKNAVDVTLSFNLTGLWVWASMARQGLTQLRWQEFAPRIAVIAKAPEEAPADPTQPAVPTGSP